MRPTSYRPSRKASPASLAMVRANSSRLASSAARVCSRICERWYRLGVSAKARAAVTAASLSCLEASITTPISAPLNGLRIVNDPVPLTG